MSRRRRRRVSENPRAAVRTLVFIFILSVVVWLLVSVPRWYMDYLWFRSEGYANLFLKPVFYRMMIFIGAFAIGAMAFEGQLLAMFRRDLREEEEVYYPDEILTVRERIRAWGLDVVRRIFSVAAVAIALLMAQAQARYWLDYLMGWNAEPFGFRDPVFSRDASFYVLVLPAFRHLLAFVGALVFFSFGLSVFYYLASGTVRIFARGQFDILHGFAKRHLAFLTGCAFCWFGVRYLLERYALVSHAGTLIAGASRTDVTVRIPFLIVLAILCFAFGFLMFAAPRRFFRARFVGFSVLVVFGASFVAAVSAGIYQSVVVAPNEVSAERVYIERHIEATRVAYGIEGLKEATYTVKRLTEEEIGGIAQSALENMRLWDHRPLLEVYQQVQTFRPYYSFYDVDIDRYRINGELQQVMLAARELDAERLPPDAKTWVNLTFLYTHGYGVAMSPVHLATPEGMPVFYLRDLPVTNAANDAALNVARPQIYFGEAPYRPIVVGSTYDEVDYPLGEASARHRFEGSSGIPIGSLSRRVLAALYFGDYRFLVSSAIRRGSRLLFRRNLQERLKTLLPGITWSNDPYIVVSRDELYWIVDGFVSARGFPYSQPANGEGTPNYYRSPLKAVISAYSGETRFYVIQDEPLLKALSRIFPNVFLEGASAPADLRAHWRYPEALFKLQANVLLRYHITDPVAFYNQEDLWRIPEEVYYGDPQEIQPYYIVVSLEDEPPQFVLMLPLSPARRDNLIGWFYAGNDGGQYGDLRLFKFPRDTLTYGPMQIEARIDQDPVISRDLTLWGQGGSSVIRGNLLVLPVGGTVLYVEPLFIQAEKGKIPELKRVTLGTFDRVVMAENVAEAIRQLSGRATLSGEVGAPASEAGDLGRVRALVRQMDEALKRGDLAEFDRLFRILKSEAGIK